MNKDSKLLAEAYDKIRSKKAKKKSTAKTEKEMHKDLQAGKITIDDYENWLQKSKDWESVD